MIYAPTHLTLQTQNLHKACCPVCFLQNKTDSAAVRTLRAGATLISKSEDLTLILLSTRKGLNESWVTYLMQTRSQTCRLQSSICWTEKKRILNCFAPRKHPVAQFVLKQDFS